MLSLMNIKIINNSDPIKNYFRDNQDNQDNQNNQDVQLNEKILVRKKKLYSSLSEEKLTYVKNGICDSYILYGKPSLNNVLDNIKVKNATKMNRLMKLLNKLNELGEEYDEDNSYFKKYLIIGKNLNYYVTEGIKEWFYLNKTIYPSLIKKYSNSEFAKIKALNDYIKQNGTDKYTEMIRKEDMVVRLY